MRDRAAARLRHFVAFGRLQTLTVLSYRADYLFNIVGLLLQVLLLKLVWTAVYADAGAGSTGTVNGIDLRTQIAYSTLGVLQFWVLNPWGFSMIPQRVRDGKIAIDLARPVRFLDQALAAQTGLTAGLLPFALVALPFAILVGGARPPASAAAAIGYVVSLLLGYLVTVLTATVVAMTTFWTLEVGGFFMIYRMAAQFFAGALVPLWFMPDWLRALTEWLPFQTSTYVPLAIYLGRTSGPDVFGAIGLQVAWIVGGWVILRLVWSRALRRVVSQGG